LGPPSSTGASAGNEDGTEKGRGDSEVSCDGRVSSWIDDRRETIYSLDRGRADRCYAAASKAAFDPTPLPEDLPLLDVDKLVCAKHEPPFAVLVVKD
jgi:hypothetical protein